MLLEEPTDITPWWRDDLVAFVIGCSFSFEEALFADGIPLRHIERGSNVPMWRTSIADRRRRARSMGRSSSRCGRCRPADAIRAIQITSRFPSVHGAPVHIGKPELIGIADLAQARLRRCRAGRGGRAAGVLGLRGDAASRDRGGLALRSRSRTRRARCSSPISRTAASRSSEPATGEPDEDDQAPHRRVRGRRRPHGRGGVAPGARCAAGRPEGQGRDGDAARARPAAIYARSTCRCCARACRRNRAAASRSSSRAGRSATSTARDHPPRPLGPGRYRRRAADDGLRRRAVPRHRRPRRPQPDRRRRRARSREACCRRPTRRSSASTRASSPCTRSRRRCFFCREPVTSLADLKGKKVRTGGGSLNDFITRDRRASRPASASPRSTARSSAASSTAPSPAPRPATARAGTR